MFERERSIIFRCGPNWNHNKGTSSGPVTIFIQRKANGLHRDAIVLAALSRFDRAANNTLAKRDLRLWGNVWLRVLCLQAVDRPNAPRLIEGNGCKPIPF